MPETDLVTLDVADDTGVATLTVDRPDRLNALNVDVLEGLREGVAEAEAADARTLVLAGAGDDAFVAGADISYMKDLSTPEAQAYAELGHDVARDLETFPAPVVAAVDGYAFGGGSELALACDLRVASESAVIGQTEIDLGIVPGWGGTQRLPRLVSDEVARRMVFLGERLPAEEAESVGLVGEVVADEAFDEHVAELAARLAAQPQFALGAAKEALNLAHEEPLHAGLATERRLWSGLFGTHDQREGMAAFLEDREPEFE
ncbi:enoyl-CoA hydratase/isomerase family protein [Halobaculum sp. MBLA0147]|uniref:enoyl-CoA hydratase/isomerase family protein n=1 Tax=Halobaculum sp. MBLA0147 TaxID=3079934 RepID=UPI0035269D9D